MSGFVYRVTLTTRHPATQEPYFINFECPISSLSDLVEKLNQGELIEGEALFSKRSRDGDFFEVRKRKPFAIGRNGVAHIEPPDLRFVEYVEAEDVQH